MFPWFSHGFLLVFLSKNHGWRLRIRSVGFGADPRDLDETPGAVEVRGTIGRDYGPMVYALCFTMVKNDSYNL